MKPSIPLCKTHAAISWTFQLIAAVILAQTLFFKFTGAPESKFIFSTLGVEPWGRIGTGILELIAAGLLLLPSGVPYGALLAAGLMCGALFSHLTRLGIVVQDDGGLLFGLAATVLAASLITLWLRRFQLPILGSVLSGLAHRPPMI
jgi:hypothetical protein